MNDVSKRVLQHLKQEPELLTADTIEKSAQFVAEDLGIATVVASEVIGQLIDEGFIEFTEDGPVVQDHR